MEELYATENPASLGLEPDSVIQRQADGSRSFSVASQSGKRPHYVLMVDGGKVECKCPHWKVTKICSHALAVAEKQEEIASHLTWHGKLKCAKNQNLTSGANLHVEKGKDLVNHHPLLSRKK